MGTPREDRRRAADRRQREEEEQDRVDAQDEAEEERQQVADQAIINAYYELMDGGNTAELVNTRDHLVNVNRMKQSKNAILLAKRDAMAVEVARRRSHRLRKRAERKRKYDAELLQQRCDEARLCREEEEEACRRRSDSGPSAGCSK